MRISAAIITLNEEAKLITALQSLVPADEVLVIDSGSTDRTVEVASAHGARVISHSWEGYAQQKNYAASQAEHDWILSLDADEALSPELAAEIAQLKTERQSDAVGFRMPRLASYRGRWVRHSGWYPDYKLRLYDRRRARWVGDYVHEQIQASGPVRSLRGDILHYTCDSLDEHLRTLDRYTTLAARESFATGTGWVLPKMLVGPPWKFLETYLFRQGFLDGYAGLQIASLAAYYVFEKYRKLRVLSGSDERAEAP